MKWTMLVRTGVALAALTLLATPALPVDALGLFQLDGNAVENGPAPPDDWETLCGPVVVPGGPCQNGPGPVGGANVFTGISPDPSPLTIFTGGRKDIQEISQWGHKTGEVPDKSDITNAYAAAYDHFGDLIVYFGADRVANVGDTFLGFWFFKDEVKAESDGTFSGEHTPGDTLVLVNFPQAANAVPLIQVVEWDPTCPKAASSKPQVDQCAAKNLRLRAGASGAGAICGTGGDLVCAITNTEGGPNDPTNSPWPYTSKDGFVNQFPYETFFEGGINLSEIIGGDACFSSFMAETRSSSSFTAALKDFRLDAFPVCGFSVSKACTNPRFNAAEDMIVYDITGVVTNTGFGTIYNIDVADEPPFATGPVFDGNSAALPGGVALPYSGTIEVPFSENGTMDTVTATANTSVDNSGSSLTSSATATCPVLQISPELSLTKACSTAVMLMDAKVVAVVDVAGEVCNIGDTKVKDVSVTDDKAGTLLSGVTLVAPADPQDPGATPGACQTYATSYLPAEANDSAGNPTDDPGSVVFEDTVTATGTDLFGRPVTPQPVMATCPLCPPSTP